MNIALLLKDNLRNIPPSIGKIVNYLPYNYRPGIGSVYSKRLLEIKNVEKFSIQQKQNFVFERIKKLVEYSYLHIPFYKEHYSQNNFSPDKLKAFSDIQTIPIISKAILNAYNIEQRSSKVENRYIVNTGGSSGTPFALYIEPSSMGHEWAHMHTIWNNLGYKPSDFKLVFNGRSDLEDVVQYDVIRNHFNLDIYASYQIIADKLKRVLKKYTISYLHGYPSSIYDFAIYCRDHDPELQEILSKCLRGAFLGSEYPYAQYRNVIENIFNIKTISWYGHTERAVLAFEKNTPFCYAPFLTYGFSETKEIENQDYSLIATSYYNFASPLIRYDTGDIISDPRVEGGILESFKITKGREGEFVTDMDGKRINLTGLIFGRHHKLFNHTKFIQIKQVIEGDLEIHYTSDIIIPEKAEMLFDKRNLKFNLKFIQEKAPVRTQAGKINLMIK